MDHRTRLTVTALGAAIVVLLGAGLIRVATYDEGSSVSATSAGGTTTTSFPTTVATTVPPSTVPPTTAAAPPTTSPPTTAPATPTTTAAPAPATTSAPDCGKGETRATSTVTVTSQPNPNTYVLNLKVDVINDLSKAISIDKLAVRLTYADGTYEIVDFPSAPGTQVQPHETKTLTVDHTASKSPSGTSIEGLDFHVVGQPGCPPKHVQT